MKINVEMLYDELKQTYPNIHKRYVYNAYVDCVLFLEENILDGTCYLSNQATSFKSKTSILVTTQKINHIDADYIYIEDDLEMNQLFNTIQRIFQKYNLWEQDLNHILYTSGSIQKMATASINIFNNVLATNDPSYLSCFLAVPDELKLEIQNTVTIDYMSQLFQDFKWDVTSQEPVYTEVKGYPKNLAINMFDGNHFLGTLSVSDFCQPIRSYDPYLLMILGDFMKKALILYGYDDLSGESFLEKTLSHLLLNQSLNSEEKSILSTHMNNHKQSYYQVIVFDDTIQANDEYYKFNLRTLSTNYTSYYIHAKNHFISILIQASQIDEIPDRFVDMVENNELRVGISDHFTNLFDFENYYSQACLALNVASELNRKEPIIYFKDYTIDYIMHQIKDPDILYPLGLRELMKHDLNSRVSYIDTLELYLQNNLNALQTANDLQISRNSLLSRMERLNSILNMDLDNDDLRLYLLFCIKLYKKKVH